MSLKLLMVQQQFVDLTLKQIGRKHFDTDYSAIVSTQKNKNL